MELFNQACTKNLAITPTVVYTAPNNASTNRSSVLSAFFCNKAENAVDATLYISDSLDVIKAHIGFTISVPVSAGIEMVASRIVLLNGDKLWAIASEDNVLDITVSVVEVS